ncbi:nuclear transport factor 2 family protein [Tropicimonas sp. IMCC6043]|nr:nuclear transport factor 2 family protein [Tropicimonas sp. IMCC6043]
MVRTHLRAFGALDIDALLATYSDDAEVVTPARVFTGPAEIREFLEPLVAEFSQDGISMETETIMIGNDTGFVVWHAESPDNVYDYAAETYFVDDGKIVSHSYAAKVTPK